MKRDLHQVLPDPWLPWEEDFAARSIAGITTTAGSGTQAASNNDAFYHPVVFPCDATIYALRFAGTSATGNYDLGFYDAALNRLASKGSTALSSAIQELVIPEFRVRAGEMYYAALSLSNNTATIVRHVLASSGPYRVVGYGIQASAHPLPNPGVPAAPAGANVPLFAFGVR